MTRITALLIGLCLMAVTTASARPDPVGLAFMKQAAYEDNLVLGDTTLSRAYASFDSFHTLCGPDGENASHWRYSVSAALSQAEYRYFKILADHPEFAPAVLADLDRRYCSYYYRFRYAAHEGMVDIAFTRTEMSHHEMSRTALYRLCGKPLP